MIEQLKQYYNLYQDPYHFTYKVEWEVAFGVWLDSLSNTELLTALQESKHLEIDYDE